MSVENKNQKPSLEKLQETVDKQAQIIQNLTAQYDEATKLAESATEYSEGLEDQLAKKAGEAVEGATAEAIEAPAEASEELKDSLVETVGKIDPNLAADLTQEFSDAEMAEEAVDVEKLGRAFIKILDKLSVGRGSYQDRTTRKTGSGTNTKVASKTQSGGFGSVNAEMSAKYEEEMKSIARR